jgi:hypothetical protein
MVGRYWDIKYSIRDQHGCKHYGYLMLDSENEDILENHGYIQQNEMIIRYFRLKYLEDFKPGTYPYNDELSMII